MGKTLSELIEKTSASDSDVLLIEDSTSTNRITKANFLKDLVNKTDNLSQRVEAVEKLKEGTELEVTTENGYVVCENTSNGQIEELKIEGKTLVNLIQISTNSMGRGYSYDSITKILKSPSNGKDSSSWLNVGSLFEVQSNKEYTFIYKILDSNTTVEVVTDNNNFDFSQQNCPVGLNVVKLTPKGSRFKLKVYDTLLTSQRSISHLILLEGDHTQNPPSYFEGLKSVGDGVDKIEVLSRKEDGNLFNKENVVLDSYIVYNTGAVQGGNTAYCASDFIPVEPNTKYYKTDYLAHYCFYDRNKNPIPISANNATNTFTTPPNAYYVRITVIKANLSVSKLEKGSSATAYSPYTGNKKQILYQTKEGNYEKPILRSTRSVSDTIEKHSDGKYYFHKCCEEVILNGSEDWIVNSSTTNNKSFHIANYPAPTVKHEGTIICNLFTKKNTYFEDKEGVWVDTNLIITINPSKLTTQDVQGFKTWLQSNPVTVVYELATEEVYECVNLDLDSYEGETSVIFDGGAISPKISFKIASHIANTISVLKDRIKYLEDKVMNMFKAVLAGDVQTLAYELYPEDFEKEDIEK